MPEDFHLDSISPNGLHQCVVASDGRTVWMYLHDLRSQSVIADAPICSLVPPLTLAEFKKTYKRGDAPPLVKEYSTEKAVRADLSGLILKWAEDEISVVALLEGEPLTMIVAGEKQGYSKAVGKEGPWGHSWDEKAYTEKFAKNRPPSRKKDTKGRQ
jgi:hypothetical protein